MVGRGILAREETLSGLSYSTLKAGLFKGMRNRNWFLLDGVQRGFYRACMAYARLRKAIRNPKMIGFLNDLLERLRSTPRLGAVRAALEEVERAVPIYIKSGVFVWAPQLIGWLRDESYLTWLGFTKINMVRMFKS